MTGVGKSTQQITQERDELSASVRSLAKRAAALASAAADRGVSMRFKKAMDDVASILTAAAESLVAPATPIPEVKRFGEDAPIGASHSSFVPSQVASSMALRMQGQNSPNLLPPHESQVHNCLRGSTTTMTVADLLGLLGGMAKSGVLWVQSNGETFSIVLQDGVVVHAASDRSPAGLRLGEILVAQGALTQEQFSAFLARYRTAAGKLGGVLEREEIVTRAQLSAALEYQVHRLFERLMAQDNATFVFTERPAESSDHRLRISVPMLLLESCRTQDEKSRDAK
ncbi:MAG: DUF4388 domain-containing protein [Planctomycetes bacterium]|nr:DUF4388 domain-containing protein [Planctomycetota bacterium]